jgi:hypothetical protein
MDYVAEVSKLFPEKSPREISDFINRFEEMHFAEYPQDLVWPDNIDDMIRMEKWQNYVLLRRMRELHGIRTN